ncbi:MAG: DUF3108 domain-containing protein [Zetaproteobacteria bacterium]|nr:DUF3108 domain-containing protein [Zetaproteobacteria bacterium]
MRQFSLKLILSLFLLSPSCLHANSCMPYSGETLTFSIGWEFIDAGTTVMRYSEQGPDGYRLHTDARTNKFFDIFKKVRDTMISEGTCVDQKMQSTLFQLDQLERKYTASKTSQFLWQENKVAYSHNGNNELFDVPQGHLNVLDAFTMLRTLDFKQGETLKIPVFDARKIYQVNIIIEEKTQMMKLPSGERVECVVVEPRLETEGVFSSTGKIKIWMTNDPRHIPVQMSASIKIGRIMARLVDYQQASQ